MTKKILLWVGTALMAGALGIACASQAKKAETTPVTTGSMGGDSYGTPAATENPCAGNPCAGGATEE